MQCFLIFDHLSDVVYVKSDPAFEVYIRGKWKADGFLQDENADARQGSVDYNNALVQLFSPLVTSQRIMVSQFNSPYTAMQCEDGTTLVFAEYLGYISVLIGRRDDLTETFLQRKLNIFLRLATFLCGPTLEILKVTSKDCNNRRGFLGELVDTWTTLYGREFAFLLEAEEQLLTNSELSVVWVKLLQNVLEKVRNCNARESTACHAFILVNAKILALYSRNACVLSAADMLLLIVLACTRQPDLIQSHDDSVNACKGRKNSQQGPSRPHESAPSSDSELYYSPCESPFQASSDKFAFHSEEVHSVESRSNVESGCEFNDEKLKSEEDDIKSEMTEGFVDIAAEFSCDLVFLQSSVSSLAPHVVHTTHIAKGIVLVVVSMVNRHVLSGSLVRGIDALHKIQTVTSSLSAKFTMDGLESIMRSITESLKKQKLPSAEMDVCLKRLQSGWNCAKRSGLFAFLKLRDLKCLSPRLENDISKLNVILKKCFIKYCISWFRRDLFMAWTNGSIIDAQALVRYNLADYVDYLQVKAKHNFSMAPYYSEFPGLIHFMYVDRVKNQVTVPTIDVIDELNNYESQPAGFVVGDIVWQKLYKMVNKVWKYLQMGHTSLVWRDDCFHYSYFIWFEDAVGNPLKLEVSSFSLDSFPPPGIIAKNFYRHLAKVCFPKNADYIRCYELFCVHLSTVPPSMVNKHARRLAAKIWEISGAAESPIDLI